MLKLAALLGVIILAFLAYVATREGKFRYERSGLINAAPDKIFPYISRLKLGGAWNPYAKKDPTMKTTFGGTDGQVGSTMEFDGNKDAGSGKLEILKVVPNQSVEMKLTMLKPIHGENLIQYTLTPEAGGTRFNWAMSGDGGFMGKLLATLIDCEKMVTADFEAGIASLKEVVEKSK